MKLLEKVLLFLVGLILAGSAQEKERGEGIDPRFANFSNAYAILVEIEESLKAIESQHPAIRDEVEKVRKELSESAVGKGFAGLVAALKEMTGDEFAGYDEASRKQVRDLGVAQKMDQEMAKIGLENIAKIKMGNLPTEILRTVIALNPEYRVNPLKEFQDGWVAGFSTKMDLVERKVHYLMYYPGSWKPAVVAAKNHLFVADSDDGFGQARLSLIVIDAPDPKFAKMDPVELAKLLVPPAGKVIESRKAVVAGLPAGLVVYDLKAEGTELTMRQMSYTVHAKEEFVTITATLDPRGGDVPEVETRRLLPLLDEIAAKLEID